MIQEQNQEIEIKLKLPDGFAPAREQLRQLGFKTAKARVFESNLLLDTAGRTLREATELLRIRQVGQRTILTYKGKPTPGKHKIREEIETEIASPDKLELIFGRLGYQPVFRYEKFRTEFDRAGQPGVVTLDETPIGNYLEIEGPPEWIDEVAKSLGFSEANYITSSYGRLYQEYCAERGIPPSNMTFSSDSGIKQF